MNRDDLRVAGWISFIVVLGFCITFGILGAIAVAPPAPEKPTNYEICVYVNSDIDTFYTFV